MLRHTSDEWLAFAKEADIPMVRMQHFSELSEDEQALANGYIQNVVYPSGTVYKVASSPIEMDSVGELTTEPTRAPGADTAEVVFRYEPEIVSPEAQLEQLKSDGVVGW